MTSIIPWLQFWEGAIAETPDAGCGTRAKSGNYQTAAEDAAATVRRIQRRSQIAGRI